MNIPKVIHQIWFSKLTVPLFFINLSDSWKVKYNEWDYVLWNTETSVKLINE